METHQNKQGFIPLIGEYGVEWQEDYMNRL